MSGNHKYRVNNPEKIGCNDLGIFNSDDTDNITMRILKSITYCIFLWFFNIYNCLIFFGKKQYRTVNFLIE